MTYLYEYEDEETGDDLLYTSDLTASFGIRLNAFDNRLRTDINTIYTGEQMIKDYQYGTSDIIELDSSVVVNLSAQYTFYKSKTYGDLTLQSHVKNLFNEDHEYVQGYPMPGISYYLGLCYEL